MSQGPVFIVLYVECCLLCKSLWRRYGNKWFTKINWSWKCFSMDSYFNGKQWFEVKNVLMDFIMMAIVNRFSTSQTLLDWMDSCELLVDYCDVLSAVWTLILTAPIYSRGSIGANNVMLNFSVSVLMKKTNSSTSWMAWRLIFFYTIFIFAWGITLNWTNHASNSGA